MDRGFLEIGSGQIHFRRAGSDNPDNLPLFLAHGGPGSSASLIPLIADLSGDRLVVAPDMMGNGDSDPPPRTPTSIEFYAECLIAVMDNLRIVRARSLRSAYGSGQVMCEVADRAPERVGCLVVDGLSFCSRRKSAATMPLDMRLPSLPIAQHRI